MLRIALLLLYVCTLSAQRKKPCDGSEILDSLPFRVQKLKMNSDHADYAPFKAGDKMYFVSARGGMPGVEFRDRRYGTQTTDLFEAKIKDSVSFTGIQEIKGDVNDRFHQGPFCISDAGDKLIYTSNDDQTAFAKLWLGEKIQGRWQKVRQLFQVADSVTCSHPSLSSNADTLWFSSNIAGGYGGMDLYYSVRKGEDWSRPTNGGRKINSPYNEIFPFYKDGSLYFSSNRPGNGGLDIYSVSLADSTIQTLAYPINSSADDFGMWTNSGKASGYFSSNREKRSGDDIYVFNRMMPEFEGARTLSVKKRYCYLFYDTITRALNDTATFDFSWDFGDGKKGRGITCRHCYEKPGEYKVLLTIVQSVNEEKFTNYTSYHMSVDPAPAIEILAPASASINEELQLAFKLEGFDSPSSRQTWLFGNKKWSPDSSPCLKYDKHGNYQVSLVLYFPATPGGPAKKYVTRKQIQIAPHESRN
jgi:hypothetical protein